MPETKSAKIEERVEGLGKELEESRGAVRRLFEQQRSMTAEIAKLREDLSRLQQVAARLQNQKNMYENTIQRYE